MERPVMTNTGHSRNSIGDENGQAAAYFYVDGCVSVERVGIPTNDRQIIALTHIVAAQVQAESDCEGRASQALHYRARP